MSKKLTASERIKALEETIVDMAEVTSGHTIKNAQQEAQINELAQVIDEMDRKFIALAKRVNATISASSSEKAVDSIMQEENAKELKRMVDTLLEQGVLIDDSEGSVITESFVVGRHITKEGGELTPRLQFYTATLAKEEQDKFLGHKVGDMILSDDNEVSIEITEIYSVKNPEMDISFEEEPEEEEDLSSEKTETEEVVDS